MRLGRTLTTLACFAGVFVAGPASAGPGVPNPVVEGPVHGGLRGHLAHASLYDLAPYGYVEEEFFIAGVSHSRGEGPSVFLPGGLPDSAAPYKTRIIVRRPADSEAFNGTVVVEWLNESGPSDLDIAWSVGWQNIVREGYAYVGVSAQPFGVCCAPGSLKVWDPLRYATLVHPGDAYSYDIFSQAIKAVRDPLHNATTILHPGVVDPMGGIGVRRVIATGNSQSAIALTRYVNDGFHAAARVIDAFIIARDGGPYPALDTPVLQLNEEGKFSTRQPDSAFFRLWEEAGTAHIEAVQTNYQWAVVSRDLAGTPLPDAVNAGCSVNRGTFTYTADAGLFWVDRWLRDGTPPPVAPRLQTDANGNVVRDGNGLALGGLRHPFVQVPLGLNYSVGLTGAPQGCPLWGSYQPWSLEKIRSLYPTRQDYVTKVHDWADDEVAAGFLVPVDADDVKAKAAAFDVWSPGSGSCFDTYNRSGDETGPVSSVLHGATYGTLGPSVGFGAAPAAHDVSCNVVAPLGL